MTTQSYIQPFRAETCSHGLFGVVILLPRISSAVTRCVVADCLHITCCCCPSIGLLSPDSA
jgi:hypothetical protein